MPWSTQCSGTPALMAEELSLKADTFKIFLCGGTEGLLNLGPQTDSGGTVARESFC